MVFEKRIQKLRYLLWENNLPALLVANPGNLLYLTGFKAEGCLLLVIPDQPRPYFLATPLYYLQASKELKGFLVLEYKKLAEVTRQEKLTRLFLEKDLNYLEISKIKKNLKHRRLLLAEGKLVEDLRAIKDKEEITLIKKAVQITRQCFRKMISQIKPGVKEKEILDRVELYLRKNGAESSSFAPILSSGSSSAFPHYRSANRQVLTGPVIFDLGCVYRGYCSDFTRTIYLNSKKRIDNLYQKVYNTIFKAQKRAIEIIKPGIRAKEVDRAARAVIEQAGYGRYFVHSTGHGIGLEVHEEPTVSSDNREILQEGMVLTVEPAVYLPGWGGVRLEDMVLVTRNGYEVLT